MQAQAIVQALVAEPERWHHWWTSADPEQELLPHGTTLHLAHFQELLFLRVLR